MSGPATQQPGVSSCAGSSRGARGAGSSRGARGAGSSRGRAGQGHPAVRAPDDFTVLSTTGRVICDSTPAQAVPEYRHHSDPATPASEPALTRQRCSPQSAPAQQQTATQLPPSARRKPAPQPPPSSPQPPSAPQKRCSRCAPTTTAAPEPPAQPCPHPATHPTPRLLRTNCASWPSRPPPSQAGSRLVVLEGVDGRGRPYVSQVLVDRARADEQDQDGDGLQVHEPAFWLGIAYSELQRGRAWSTATDDAAERQDHNEQVRRACTDTESWVTQVATSKPRRGQPLRREVRTGQTCRPRRATSRSSRDGGLSAASKSAPK